MNKIIIDTNFLLVPEQFKVDIFTEIKNALGDVEFYIIDKTLDELQKIIDNGGKDKIAAKIGLELVKRKKLNELTSTSYVDDAIVEVCKQDPKFMVATNDVVLKRKLRKINIKTIELKQKKYIIINK
jgi:rRNA-processing protein FCF1